MKSRMHLGKITYSQRITSSVAVLAVMLLLSLVPFDAWQDTRNIAHSFDMETCQIVESDVDLTEEEDEFDCYGDESGSFGISVRIPVATLSKSNPSMRTSMAKISDDERLGQVRRHNPEGHSCGFMMCNPYKNGAYSREYAPFFILQRQGGEADKIYDIYVILRQQIIPKWN